MKRRLQSLGLVALVAMLGIALFATISSQTMRNAQATPQARDTASDQASARRTKTTRTGVSSSIGNTKDGANSSTTNTQRPKTQKSDAQASKKKQDKAKTEKTETLTANDAADDEQPATYTWWCGRDYEGAVPEDGSLVEWAPRYYVAHHYGAYGKAILGLKVEDQITVNGSLVTVEGAVEMPLYSSYEDVMSTVGWDATVFQTCIPNTGSCRYVYARGLGYSSAAAQEAREWARIHGTSSTTRTIEVTEDEAFPSDQVMDEESPEVEPSLELPGEPPIPEQQEVLEQTFEYNYPEDAPSL